MVVIRSKIEKFDQFESEHSASLDSESSDSNESPFSSVHHHLPPRCHLPRSLQLALVQTGASGMQVASGGQGDSDHPPAPSYVRVARRGASGTVAH